MADHDLSGKVAVVTGAGRGIGRAIAVGFAQAGASVSCAARTASEIEEAAAEIRDSGGTAIARTVDVTDCGEVERLFEETSAELGGVDIVVANAGGNMEANPVESSDPGGWEATVSVNLFGAYHCIRAAIPHMRRRGGGKIITLGSGMGHRGRAGSSAYCCAKAALWMLTRVSAQELWEDGISVNELIPGPVRTSATAGAGTGSVFGIDSEWVKEPEDVVPMALFLACQPEVGPTAQSYSLMRRDM
ncbi:SDR family NAD(P)-dependent oxidoreductase [Candidatus Latescibacterota bacterium]